MHIASSSAGAANSDYLVPPLAVSKSLSPNLNVSASPAVSVNPAQQLRELQEHLAQFKPISSQEFKADASNPKDDPWLSSRAKEREAASKTITEQAGLENAALINLEKLVEHALLNGSPESNKMRKESGHLASQLIDHLNAEHKIAKQVMLYQTPSGTDSLATKELELRLTRAEKLKDLLIGDATSGIDKKQTFTRQVENLEHKLSSGLKKVAQLENQPVNAKARQDALAKLEGDILDLYELQHKADSYKNLNYKAGTTLGTMYTRKAVEHANTEYTWASQMAIRLAKDIEKSKDLNPFKKEASDFFKQETLDKLLREYPGLKKLHDAEQTLLKPYSNKKEGSLTESDIATIKQIKEATDSSVKASMKPEDTRPSAYDPEDTLRPPSNFDGYQTIRNDSELRWELPSKR